MRGCLEIRLHDLEHGSLSAVVGCQVLRGHGHPSAAGEEGALLQDALGNMSLCERKYLMTRLKVEVEELLDEFQR